MSDVAAVSFQERIAALLDKEAVADVIRRYAYGIDTRDEALVRACFDPDADIIGTVSTGPLREYLPRLLEDVNGYGATMHQLGTQLIDVHSDRATAKSYAVARHFRDPEGTEEVFVVGVRYDDSLRRDDGGGWRIVERHVVPIWRRTRAESEPR